MKKLRCLALISTFGWCKISSVSIWYLNKKRSSVFCVSTYTIFLVHLRLWHPFLKVGSQAQWENTTSLSWIRSCQMRWDALFRKKSFIIRSSLRILLTPNAIIMAESNQLTNQRENIPGSAWDIVAKGSGSAKTCWTRSDE